MSQYHAFANLMTEERVWFVLTVSRDNLLNGTLISLGSVNEAEFKKPLRVRVIVARDDLFGYCWKYVHVQLCMSHSSCTCMNVQFFA